jgi:hypothetical protein
MKATLRYVKAEHHYSVVDAPDVKHPNRRLTIRPDRVVIRSYADSDAIAVVSGPSVRRDNTLGAQHSVVFSSLDLRFGREIPDWVDKIVSDTGLTWERPDGAR